MFSRSTAPPLPTAPSAAPTASSRSPTVFSVSPTAGSCRRNDRSCAVVASASGEGFRRKTFRRFDRRLLVRLHVMAIPAGLVDVECCDGSPKSCRLSDPGFR
jgi:hypothetical protein